MGCGILFPRDYSAENDSDGTRDSSDVSEGEDVEDYIEVEDYNSDASDDDMWMDRANQVEKGTKVEVGLPMNRVSQVEKWTKVEVSWRLSGQKSRKVQVLSLKLIEILGL